MSTLLQVENASKSFGEKVLFRNITFHVNKGRKVALIAKNGTGKTTLLNILAGKDSFDDGSYVFQKNIKVSYLEQDPGFQSGLTLFNAVYGAPGKLMETVREYEKALHQQDQKRLQECIFQMDFHHAWDLDSRIKQMLSVLKLNDEEQLVDTLSGGQIKRLALAIALINNPQFLILDEPTNHLDLDMIEWLEDYLAKSNMTLLMVTHDRYFLDRICNEIVEIDERSIYSYNGNYSYFLQKREDRITNKALVTEKAQNLLRKELDWIRRMPKARTTKAKYRIDAFYELKNQSEYRRDDRQVQIGVSTVRLGNKILYLHNVNKSFDEKKMLDNFSYTFTKGEKIGIIGPNGSGKTTFLNIITNRLQPDSGKIDLGETVVYGYYQQKGLEFKSGIRVIDIVKEIAEVITMSDGKQLSAGQFLNLFLFSPEMQYVVVDKLSGGEKRRLYMCTVLMKNPNFLILDEPTNDFDIVTLNILEEYLLNFKGCIIIVSHDRFFMDKIVDHLFIFEGNGEIYDFPGNYSDYSVSKKQTEIETRRNEAEKSKNTSFVSKEQDSLPKKKLSFKQKKEIEDLSAEIELLENEKNTLEISLSDRSLKPDELFQISVRIGELISIIDKKTDHWIGLSEKI